MENEEKNTNLVRTLKFLGETSEGKYSRIETSSLRYVRIKELTEPEYELYYYSIS